jgi:hypothetical protein
MNPYIIEDNSITVDDITIFNNEIIKYIDDINVDDVNKLDPSHIIHIIDFINDSYQDKNIFYITIDILDNLIKLATLVKTKSELFKNSYSLFDLVKYDSRTNSIIFIIKNYDSFILEMDDIIENINNMRTKYINH